MTGRALAKTVCCLLAGLAAAGSAAAIDAQPGNRQIQSISPVKSSIRRDGDRAEMIVLFSYKRMQSGRLGDRDRPKVFYYTSTRSSIEFDCRDHRSRILRTVFFSDRMGRGNVVHQQEATGGWRHDDDYGQKDSLSFIACQSTLPRQ